MPKHITKEQLEQEKQLPQFLITYECPHCSTHWNIIYPHIVNDPCPNCHTHTTPYTYEDYPKETK